MLDGNSPPLLHALQNILLVLLSFSFLPLDISILASTYILQISRKTLDYRRHSNSPQCTNGRPFRVLITGVGMAKGLTLARLFQRSGHAVIGADFESHRMTSPGRMSNSLQCFHALAYPDTTTDSTKYVESLLSIIVSEKVDLWVSCSGVASAVEDGEAKEVIENRTSCKAIQFDIATTQTLHEKHTFMSHTQEMGLNVPQFHTVQSRDEVELALENAPEGMKFIMKTIGMNDQARGNMTLLPMASKQATKDYLDRLEISKKSQWILQQFIKGNEYCTHALVIRGKVLAFVACPSSELLMHYEALPPTSALSQAMLRFTQEYAATGGEDFTGHLSFDFLVEDATRNDPEAIALYPIECNPRAHTAVVLFSGTSAMVDAYTSVLENGSDGVVQANLVTPANAYRRYYWGGHDLVSFVLYPALQLLQLNTGPFELVRGFGNLVCHLAFWKDGTFDLWDPLPWFYLYHVYWPMQFLICLTTGKKWSRINVSTLKMFEC